MHRLDKLCFKFEGNVYTRATVCDINSYERYLSNKLGFTEVHDINYWKNIISRNNKFSNRQKTKG